MRLSQFFLPTEKEDRSEAAVASHRLMIRAGMIRQLTAGVYSYLPLGLRAVRKVAQIVREEMDRAGAQEVLLPALQPADLWRESGRWEHFGPELVRLRDRNEREFCLGPTHEEVVTDLVRREVRSYRQLPLILYQVQTKFRDERRPRFGVMRAREFTMKDAYSFDSDEQGAEQSYWRMYRAYSRIFQRSGLRFRAVEAETGAIGGSFSHEFMVLAESGEDTIVSCDSCDYAANVERAELSPPPPIGGQGERACAVMEQVATPGMRTVEEVCGFLGKDPSSLIKTLLFLADGKPVGVLVRGDREVNEAKVKRVLGCEELSLADEQTVVRLTGAPVGFAGPVGLGSRGEGIPVLADQEVMLVVDGVTGANLVDAHFLHVLPGRDFRVDRVEDLRTAVAGDPCPRCAQGRLQIWRGIEVGHIFKLGTKYSEAMGATFQDERGQEWPMVMGCYGIGIERTVAAAIEQNHDQEGIIFPMAIAPFQVIVLCLQQELQEVREAAERIYTSLQEEGVEVLLDDREDRPGSKFKDADLIGVPLRINVGARSLARGLVELRHRATGRVEMLGLESVCERVKEIIRDQTERDIGSSC